tara:strand:- start:646 stop:2406 length:1761 start_codon:yes stop_codon:yes gene_type:complete
MRLCDFVVQYLEDKGVRYGFGVMGGGAMFLNDALAQNKKIRTVFNHHEQASAMAAVGSTKSNGIPSAVFPTTGCGGTNTITGLLDAWQDSVPCIFISGQVNKAQTTYVHKGPRKIGVQEANIVEIVKSITKYSTMLTEPEEILQVLDEAWLAMTSGRKGPVWIDIPMDVQNSDVDPSKLRSAVDAYVSPKISSWTLSGQLNQAFNDFSRPLFLIGEGLRTSGQIKSFLSIVEKHNIPFVTTYLGADICRSDHPLNIGRVGIKGSRAGNFALQNSTLLMTLGCSLSTPVTGFNPDGFAPKAYKIVVDIDEKEHAKPAIRKKINHFIHGDLKDVIEVLSHLVYRDYGEWPDKCLHWKNKWPVCLPEYKDTPNAVNMYYLIDRLSAAAKEGCRFVADAGSAIYVPSQALQYKDNQRFVLSAAQADMGFTLPAAIGCALDDNQVIAITGDGSLQMNIQEFQTLVQYNLPVKLFVMNNNGYLSIRATQKKFFEGRLFGTDKQSGISFPILNKVCEAYGLQYALIDKNETIDDNIKEVLEKDGPVICEVICPEDQLVIPTLGTKVENNKIFPMPLENMSPFLSDEEVKEEML